MDYETEDEWRKAEYGYTTMWYGIKMSKCCEEEVRKEVSEKWRRYRRKKWWGKEWKVQEIQQGQEKLAQAYDRNKLADQMLSKLKQLTYS